jgi:hypothetical protein
MNLKIIKKPWREDRMLKVKLFIVIILYYLIIPYVTMPCGYKSELAVTFKEEQLPDDTFTYHIIYKCLEKEDNAFYYQSDSHKPNKEEDKKYILFTFQDIKSIYQYITFNKNKDSYKDIYKIFFENEKLLCAIRDDNEILFFLDKYVKDNFF